jgi:hypothetical protein
LRNASALNPRGAHGSRRLKTTTSRFFCSHRQVQPELLFHVSVAPAWKQRSPETVAPFAKDAHAIFPASCLAVQHRVDDPDIRIELPRAARRLLKTRGNGVAV